jgi:y4mF family transcriptional regulator
MDNLSRFIKERRTQADLTQADLAAKAGVGLRFLRDLEQGKKTLRLDKVNQVLALFGHETGPVKKAAGNPSTPSDRN